MVLLRLPPGVARQHRRWNLDTATSSANLVAKIAGRHPSGPRIQACARARIHVLICLPARQVSPEPEIGKCGVLQGEWDETNSTMFSHGVFCTPSLPATGHIAEFGPGPSVWPTEDTNPNTGGQARLWHSDGSKVTSFG